MQDGDYYIQCPNCDGCMYYVESRDQVECESSDCGYSEPADERMPTEVTE